jgi:hypothetical protein
MRSNSETLLDKGMTYVHIFFKVVFFILFLVAVVNLIKVAVDYALIPKVYACSEVTGDDPIMVQMKCHKWRKT